MWDRILIFLIVIWLNYSFIQYAITVKFAAHKIPLKCSGSVGLWEHWEMVWLLVCNRAPFGRYGSPWSPALLPIESSQFKIILNDHYDRWFNDYWLKINHFNISSSAVQCHKLYNSKSRVFPHNRGTFMNKANRCKALSFFYSSTFFMPQILIGTSE